MNNEKREGKKRQRSNKTTNEEKDLEKGVWDHERDS